MRLPALIRLLLVPLLMVGCAKEPSVEPLPLVAFAVHDAVPVRAVRLGATNGVALLCKRAIDDPVLAEVLLFGTDGSLTGRIDLDLLPNVVENIAFAPESWFITDLVPASDGTMLLIGLGRQADLADRLHLLVYHVNATGTPLAPPVRRYVTDQLMLERADDIDQLYRTTARAALRTPDQLVATVRYDRQEGPLMQAYQRSFQIGLAAGAGSYGTAAAPLASVDHALWQVVADGLGGSYHLIDTTRSGGPGTQLLVKHHQWGAQAITSSEQGIVELRDAEPHAAMITDGQLVMAGAYQTEADVRRAFFCRASGMADLNAGITFPDLGANERSVAIGALAPVDGGFVAIANVYEQRVISVRAMRDDRFCDLVSARLNSDGAQLDNRMVIPGKGLRVLGSWRSAGELAVGAFHPFLNTDYMHAFVTRTSAP